MQTPASNRPQMALHGKLLIERPWQFLKDECIDLKAWGIGSQARAGIKHPEHLGKSGFDAASVKDRMFGYIADPQR